MEQLISTGFLRVHTRNLLNPTDPPIAVLFHDSGVGVHPTSPRSHTDGMNLAMPKEEATS
jgi:hypothetical protein